jgi:hypothetical protein
MAVIMHVEHSVSKRLGSVARALGSVTIAVAATLVASGAVASGSGTESVVSPRLATSAPCSASLLKFSTTTNQKSYLPGAVVKMTFSITNKSSSECTTTVGPTSPSFAITNSKGVEVWNNCYSNDRPGACAMYLMLRHIKAGATYSETFTWDQRSGASRARVPIGVYQLTVGGAGTAGKHSVKFVVARSPRTFSATQADSGRTYSLRVGDHLVVNLSGPTIYSWTEITSSNQSVLLRLSASSGATATATLVARAKGEARVTAIDNPNCYPQCLPPSRLFTITTRVVG